MKYFVGTYEAVELLNTYIGTSLFRGNNYSSICETADGVYYIAVRNEELYLLSDEQMTHVFDNVNTKEQEIET